MEIDNSAVPMLVKALDHYIAYLAATRREDSAFSELAETLKRKGPERAMKPLGDQTRRPGSVL